MRRFSTWLKKNGVKDSAAKIIKIKNNERSVVSRKNLNIGDNFVLIPKKLLIHSSKIQKTTRGKYVTKLFKNYGTFLCKIINITVYMLLEVRKGKKSFWYPYLSILPETLNHIPVFWEKDLKYLRGSDILNDIDYKKRQLQDEYDILKSSKLQLHDLTLAEYMRMRSLVSSRNFSLYIDGEENSVMVPLADMLNHSNSADTHWTYNTSLNAYQMTATKKIKVGQEISDSYGRKNNDVYFLHYGFLLPHAPLSVNIGHIQITNNMTSYSINRILNSLSADKKSAIRKLKSKVKSKIKSYPKDINFYKRNKNTGGQNKKNAYNLIFMELSVLQNCLKLLTNKFSMKTSAPKKSISRQRRKRLSELPEGKKLQEVEAGHKPIAVGPGYNVKISGLINCIGVIVTQYSRNTGEPVFVIAGHFETPTMYDSKKDKLTNSGKTFATSIRNLIKGIQPNLDTSFQFVYGDAAPERIVNFKNVRNKKIPKNTQKAFVKLKKAIRIKTGNLEPITGRQKSSITIKIPY